MSLRTSTLLLVYLASTPIWSYTMLFLFAIGVIVSPSKVGNVPWHPNNQFDVCWSKFKIYIGIDIAFPQFQIASDTKCDIYCSMIWNMQVNYKLVKLLPHKNNFRACNEKVNEVTVNLSPNKPISKQPRNHFLAGVTLI